MSEPSDFVNYLLSQVQSGAQGPVGPQGMPGPQGPQGPLGPTGPAGAGGVLSWLTPHFFGVKGDGSDETAAMQRWATAISAGQVGYLPCGYTYGISQPITFTGNAPITIRGDGLYQGSIIQMLSPTQDGLVFNSPGRIGLYDFTVASHIGATAGANIRFAGIVNTTVGTQIVRLSMYTCFVGIAATGMGAYYIDGIDFATRPGGIGIQIDDGGDSTITNYRIEPGTNGVGISLGGNPGGIKILGGKINSGLGYTVGIAINIQKPDGDIQIKNGSIEGFVGNGILINGNNSVNFGNLNISGMQIASNSPGTRAIYIIGNGLRADEFFNGINRNVIHGNITQSNLGIAVDALGNFTLQGNICPDAGSAIVIGANCAYGDVSGNIAGKIVNGAGPTVFVGKNVEFN